MKKTNQKRWLIFQSEEANYPYWLFIEEHKGQFIFLKTKDKWPGPGKNIFCLLVGEAGENDLPASSPIDECGIVRVSRFGKKMIVILDRMRSRRCWFIFIKKEYKSRPGEYYHQVFWITQSSSTSQRRGPFLPRIKIEEEYKILIDKNERYAYSFPGFYTEKTRLSAGDYALSKNGKIVATVERKTKDNIFHEISFWEASKTKLMEMDKYRYKAIVLEGAYDSFISPKNKFYSSSFIGRILADLAVSFPSIQIIFCKGRKSANRWVVHYFQQIAAVKKLD